MLSSNRSTKRFNGAKKWLDDAGVLGRNGDGVARQADGTPTPSSGGPLVPVDPDFTIGQLARAGDARASDLTEWASSQGWKQSQTPTGPIKFTDENGVVRLTVKRGSDRAPGSGAPHIEIRNVDGQRIDVYGNAVTSRSPGNHTPIVWDQE